MKIKFRFENILLLFVIITGVSVSILQFMHNRSLWLDESYLALNIINRDFIQLLQPLDNNQVAPIFFLQIEKIFSVLFGYSESGFRLFPLFCYWASIYFLYKIFRILNLNTYVIIISMSLFVFNGTIIYYSSEVKQYMIDVLVLSGMYYFTLRNYEKPKIKYILLGVFGTISIFLSNVSPIILLCCGIYLFHTDFKGGWKELKYIFITSTVWLFFFGLYFLFFIYQHPIREFMLGYWSMEGAFMPLNPFDIEFYKFLIRKYYFFYHDLFEFGWVGFYILQIVFLFGCFNLMEKKQIRILFLGIAPVLVHLGLSSLKLYPFVLRLILYTIPAFLIILSFGLDYAISFITKVNKHITLLFSAVVVICLLFVMYVKVPIERSELKECFSYVKKNIKEEDTVYLSYFSSFPFEYYKQISGLDYPDNKVFYGKLENPNEFINEIKNFDGKHWFVFSNYTTLDREYMRLMVEDFQKRNYRLLKEFHPKGASVFLYEIVQ